jgi:hypothetical protein
METHQTKASEDSTEELSQSTAGEKKFLHLQESPKDYTNSNTNGINKHFNDVLEEWRRKDGPMEDKAKRISDKPIENSAELTAGEYAIKLPYHPQETPSDIEEVVKARMKAPDGDKKETSQEKSASDLEQMKIFFEYIITKQNK